VSGVPTYRDPDLSHDFPGDFVLQGKYVAEITIVSIGPKMSAARRIDQLCRDTYQIP
jgi:hypothetical protein